MNFSQIQSYIVSFSHGGSCPLFNFDYQDTLDSTNRQIWRKVEDGVSLPLVSIAGQQTAGQGQWGRVWLSGQGGLYLSLGLTCQIELKDQFHLTLLTAWGIVQNLQNYQIPVKLKWPNDLILEGKKLGGIKIETRCQSQGINQAVIGVGINYANLVPETAINLSNYPCIDSLELLASLVIDGIFAGYARYEQEGIKRIFEGYCQQLETVGKEINFQGHLGIIEGVEETGELRVRLVAQGSSSLVRLPIGSIRLNDCLIR